MAMSHNPRTQSEVEGCRGPDILAAHRTGATALASKRLKPDFTSPLVDHCLTQRRSAVMRASLSAVDATLRLGGRRLAAGVPRVEPHGAIEETGRGAADVTIVIASRNRWPDLQRSLTKHQEPVILVDNGSTDGTAELV